MMLGTMPIPNYILSTTVLSGTSMIEKGPQSVSVIKRFFSIVYFIQSVHYQRFCHRKKLKVLCSLTVDWELS